MINPNSLENSAAVSAALTLSNQKHQTLATDLNTILAGLADRLRNLQAGFSAVGTEKTKIKRGYERAIDTLEQIKVTVDNRLRADGDKSILSIAETARVSKQLAYITKNVDNSEVKKLSQLLADHVFADWLSRARTDIENKIYDELKPLGEVGASKVKSIKVEVKGGANVYGADLQGSVGGEYQDILDADDEGLFFRTKIKTLAAGLNGGLNAGLAKIGARLKGSHSRFTFEEYNNVKAYVNMEAHNLTTLKRSDYELKKASRKFSWGAISRFLSNHFPGNAGSELKLYHKQLQKAVNNQHQLNELLANQLGIEAKVVVNPPQLPETLRGYIYSNSGSIDGSAVVGLGDTNLSASAGFKISKTKTEIFEFVPTHFWQVVKDNAERLNELPEGLIAHGRNLLNRNSAEQPAYERAVAAIDTLNQDFSDYITAVQKYDAGDQTQRQVKHAIESRWGVSGRHVLLRAVYASFALFGNEARQAATSDTELTAVTEQMEKLAVQLEAPPIKHSRQQLEDVASFRQLIRLSISDTKASFTVAVGPVSAEVTVLKRHRVHPSRLRDGDYIDVELKLQGNGSVGDITGLMDTVTAKLADNYPGLIDANTFKSEVSNFFQNNIEASGAGAIRRVDRFIKPSYQQAYGDNEYHHQFTRYLLTGSASINGGTSLPVGAGGNVGFSLGASYSDTRVLKEILYANTLSYVMTRHNRFARNKELKGEWLEFLDKHNGGLKNLFSNLGNINSDVYKESQHWLNELVDIAKTDEERVKAEKLKSDFNQVMSRVSDHPDDAEAFDNAKNIFNQFLSDQVKPWWDAHQSKWTSLTFSDKQPFAETFKNSLKRLGDDLQNNVTRALQDHSILPKPTDAEINSQALNKALGVEDSKLVAGFLQLLHYQGVSAATGYARNQLALSYMRWLQPDATNLQVNSFAELINGLPNSTLTTLANGQGATPLRQQLQSAKAQGVFNLQLQVGDRLFAIHLGNETVIHLYDSISGNVLEINSIKDTVAYLNQLKLKQQSWQLSSLDISQSLNESQLIQLSRRYITDLDLLIRADRDQGLLNLGNQKISRAELWLVGASLQGQKLDVDQLVSLNQLDRSIQLDAHQIDNWLSGLSGDNAYTALAKLHRWLEAQPNLLSQGSDNGANTKAEVLRQRAEAVVLLDQQLPLLTELDQNLSKTNHAIDELNARQQRLFGTQQAPNTRLNKLAKILNGVNTLMSLSRLPGNVYQTVDAFAKGEIKQGVQSLADTLTDNLDIALDVLANSTRVQAVSSRLASVAGKLGAATNFVGAGLGIWAAVDSFKAAGNATTHAEKVDHIINGSFAVAGVVVAVATGIASLVTAVAGPIGAAIGLAIGIAQGIYNAVKVRQQLSEAGISGSDLDLAGAAVFFGFPVPTRIANKAATNIGTRQWEAAQQQRLEAYAKLGVDKLVYSSPKVFTAYGNIGGVSEGYDYYNLTPAELREYQRKNPGEVDSGWMFRQEPKAAEVKKLDSYDEENGVTLIQLGKGFDWARGDANRRNIFLVGHNQGNFGRRYFGGNKADTFEIRSPDAFPHLDVNDTVRIDGGAGIDTVSFRSMYGQNGVKVNLEPTEYLNNKATIKMRDGREHTFLIDNIENIIGSEKNDEIYGNRHSNFLQGSEGNDTLNGSYGDDHLVGGTGSDYLEGSEGSDSYTVTADDWLVSDDLDTINNYSDLGLKTYRTRLEYLANNPGATDDEAIRYSMSNTSDELSVDQLITNFGDFSGYQDGGHLMLSVSRGWLNSLRLAKKLFTSKDEFTSEKLASFAQEFGLPQGRSNPLNNLTEVLDNSSSHWDLLHSDAYKTVLNQLENTLPERVDVLKIENYYKSELYQHLQFRDLLGNAYIATAKGNQVELDTMVLKTPDSGVHKVELDKRRIRVLGSSDSTPFSLVSLLSKKLLNVVGSKADDSIYGNELDNVIDGGAGFDHLSGGDGNDILIAGEDGGLLSGGRGKDTYIVGANQNQVVLTGFETTNRKGVEIAKDDLRDTLELNAGYQGFSSQINGGSISASYQGTQIVFGGVYQQDLAKRLALVFYDNKNTKLGHQYGVLSQQGKLSLTEIDFSHNDETNYQINLNTNRYQWAEGSAEIISKHQSVHRVQTGNGNDTLVIGANKEVTQANLGGGLNVLDIQGNSSIVHLTHQAGNGLRVNWRGLEWQKLKVLYKGGQLSLLNTATEDQAIVLANANELKSEQVTIQDKSGESHQLNIDLLIQTASQMSTDGASSSFLASNSELVNHDIVASSGLTG
ncbi:calcium-binding protein [Spartinivicinus ruber]|uniref:calcium-binding protein n=1 Tax=Spartinivicinus ruber TaxID=2683272 RepID=UPI0013D5BF85|nr:calcium-binding protein [Spartinivicinus ruber]